MKDNKTSDRIALIKTLKEEVDNLKKAMTGKKIKGTNPIDVKMTETEEGSDSKGAAVMVKAGAEMSNGSNTGQHKANFEKKDTNPKVSVSEPFDDKASKEMNANDKEEEKDGAKTYVEAGAEKGGHDVTTGQHKAEFKEKAPKSDKDERIAKGIEIKEGKFTKEEFWQMVNEESSKLAKQMILDSIKK